MVALNSIGSKNRRSPAGCKFRSCSRQWNPPTERRPVKKTVWKLGGGGGLDLYVGWLDSAVQSSLVTLCKVSSLSGCCFSICCDTLSRKAEHRVYHFSERNAGFALSMWPTSLSLQSQPKSFIFRVRKWWGTGKMAWWAKCLLMDQAQEPELASIAPRSKLGVIVCDCNPSTGGHRDQKGKPRFGEKPFSKMNEWMRSRAREEDTRCQPPISVYAG